MEEKYKEEQCQGKSTYEIVKEKFNGRYYQIKYSEEYVKYIYVHNICSETVLPNKFMYDGIEMIVERSNDKINGATISVRKDFIIDKDGISLTNDKQELKEITESEFHSIYRNALYLVSHKNETINASIEGSIKIVSKYFKDNGESQLADTIKESYKKCKLIQSNK